MQQTSQAEKEQVPGSTLKQAVLVADDNPINRKLTVRQLQRRGYTVDEAVDGREAVEAAKTGNYAAVLMDCEMPEMDGYQAVREIRRMEADTRHTLVVAITANETESDRQKCLAAGMDEFMSKPIRLDSLVRMIEAAAATNQPVKGAADKVATSPASAGAVLDPLMIDQLREEGQDLLDDLIEMFARKVPDLADG
jgi:CheY-like chemotaxis protein